MFNFDDHTKFKKKNRKGRRGGEENQDGEGREGGRILQSAESLLG